MNPPSNIPKNLPNELTEVLQQGPGGRIERIISTAHQSPKTFLSAQSENESVLLLQRAARIAFTDRIPTMLPGGFDQYPGP